MDSDISLYAWGWMKSGLKIWQNWIKMINNVLLCPLSGSRIGYNSAAFTMVNIIWSADRQAMRTVAQLCLFTDHRRIDRS